MYAVRIHTRCSVRDTVVLYGRCIFEVNREAGVNPARSRHCEWSVALMMPLSDSLVCAVCTAMDGKASCNVFS